MGRQHRRGIDQGVAVEGGFLAQVLVDPGGWQAEGGFAHVFARQLHLAAGGVHRHQMAQTHFACAGVHLLDADGVALGRQAHIVEDAHLRDDEAVFLGQRPAQGLDLVGQATPLQIIDQAEQRIAQLDLHLVDGQDAGDRLFDLLLGLGRCGGDLGLRRLRLQPAASQFPGHEARTDGQGGEGDQRHAGDQADQAGGAGHNAQRHRVGGQLGHHGLVRRTLDARLGHQEAGGDRDDDGRHLRHQTVADGQLHIGVGGLHRRHAVCQGSDQDAADGVDEGDDQTGHGVAAHELGRAVHGAEEGRFLLQLLAAQLGLILGDQARRQIGVDRHLLAGHGVQGEASRHFGDPGRALGDDDEVHHQDDGEDDHPDDEITAHHQLAEGVDYLPRRVVAFLAVGQNQACGGQVQAQPEQGRDQQDRREDGEVQRPLHHHGRHQDQHAGHQRDRQQQVQKHLRDRQDQQHDHADHADGHQHFAAVDPAQDVAPGGARHAVLHHHGRISHGPAPSGRGGSPRRSRRRADRRSPRSRR